MEKELVYLIIVFAFDIETDLKKFEITFYI